MINRKILYGYVIRNGDTVVKEDEAGIVTRVFALYDTGLSYQKISDILNDEDIPFSTEAPVWNKHKVKRMLENPRYTGWDDYPAIIDSEAFCRVQAQIQEKTAGYAPPENRPALKLKGLLRCGCCNGDLHRTAGKNRRKDTLYLKCGTCGTVFTMTDAELLTETSRQISEHNPPVKTAYSPSEEVIRLANAINRGLENPESPEEVVSLILRGAAARYDCCPATFQYERTDRMPTVDWNHIRHAVSYITISPENTVAVTFQ